MSNTINLVLTNHWYDETAHGRKRVEYRAMTQTIAKGPKIGQVVPSKWLHQLWHRRHQIKRVRFSRGYTSTTQTFAVVKIDIGPCPIPGWSGDYYRIHFTDLPTP